MWRNKGVKVPVGNVFSGRDGSLNFKTASRGVSRKWRKLGTIGSRLSLTVRSARGLLGSGRCDRGIEEV